MEEYNFQLNEKRIEKARSEFKKKTSKKV